MDRESEIAARKQEIAKKWQDVEITRYDPATYSTRQEIPHDYHLPQPSLRINSSHDGLNIKVSFREAMESVPYFDGYNIPLARFTRACRRAREIIPPTAERNLTKLLVNKLGNRAYYAVEDEPCETVSDLIDLLTGAFGSPKTLDQYRGELSTIFLKPGEHVLDYISRVKDLRTAILDTERREKRASDPHFINEIDSLTTRSFCDGLPFEYRIQMGPETRRRHTDAFAAAKAIAKRRELDKQREADRQRDTRYRADRDRDNRFPAEMGRPLAHSTPHRRESPPYVNNSRYQANAPQQYKSFAYTPERRFNSPQRRTPPHNNDSSIERHRTPNTNSFGNKEYCKYCKIPGHRIEDCRKRQHNNNLREQGNANGPSRRQDVAPADEPKHTRPVNTIETKTEENNHAQE
ncbi:hypothetical protein ALC57_10390 [Trachymyrmex cornetzi]|uniref:CCHC-type domain-containing protein n=1 Tax=Trachymyrmex cornetzi TaxID=471704 RepID=A0A151J464_9HYME|nr:hypothetical protein ALC57_10390 [Trachymyrmex cornetzi]